MIEATGNVSQSSGEAPRLVNPIDLRFGAVLAAISVLVDIGSFGTWSVLQPRRVATYSNLNFHLPFSRGIQSWQGQGWMTLALAVFSAAFVLLAVAKSKSEARVVAVSLLAAVFVVTTFNVIDNLFSYGDSTGLSFLVGWGLWLAFSSAILGVTIGIFWIRRVRTAPIRGPHLGAS
jgi:hypothetical protein